MASCESICAGIEVSLDNFRSQLKTRIFEHWIVSQTPRITCNWYMSRWSQGNRCLKRTLSPCKAQSDQVFVRNRETHSLLMPDYNSHSRNNGPSEEVESINEFHQWIIGIPLLKPVYQPLTIRSSIARSITSIRRVLLCTGMNRPIWSQLVTS